MQPPPAGQTHAIALTIISGSLVGSSRPSSWLRDSRAAAADCSKGMGRRPEPSSSNANRQSDMGLHAIGLEGALGPPARSPSGDNT